MKLLPFLRSAIFGGMDLSPDSHDLETLQAAREVNAELLVISMANISDALAAEARSARGHVLNIIHALDPLPSHAARPLRERPLADYDAAVAASDPALDDLTQPALDDLDRDDLSRN